MKVLSKDIETCVSERMKKNPSLTKEEAEKACAEIREEERIGDGSILSFHQGKTVVADMKKEDDCGCQQASAIILEKLERKGHSQAHEGVGRVKTEMETCITSATDNYMRLGVDEKEAKKKARDACKETGEKYHSMFP